MKDKILEKLKTHTITSHNSQKLHIADYKHYFRKFGVSKNGGKVIILDEKPDDWNAVEVFNINKIDIFFDGFEENALHLKKGQYNKQCECVLFPNTNLNNFWILFIEMKYANDAIAAFKKEHNYPENMTNQIIETVKYFRKIGILEETRIVHAVVSFPNLIIDFNSFIFNGKISIDDIFKSHKIIIRGTNSVEIESYKKLKLIGL